MKRIILILTALSAIGFSTGINAGGNGYHCQLNANSSTGQELAPCITGFGDLVSKMTSDETTQYSRCNKISNIVNDISGNNNYCTIGNNDNTRAILFKTNGFYTVLEKDSINKVETPRPSTVFSSLSDTNCSTEDWLDNDGNQNNAIISNCLNNFVRGDNGGSSIADKTAIVNKKLIIAGYSVMTLINNKNNFCIGKTSCDKEFKDNQAIIKNNPVVTEDLRNRISIFTGGGEGSLSCPAQGDRPCRSYATLTINISDKGPAFDVKGNGHLILRNLYIKIEKGYLANIDQGAKIELSNVVIEIADRTLPPVIQTDAKGEIYFYDQNAYINTNDPIEKHGVKFIGNLPTAGLISIKGSFNDSLPMNFNKESSFDPDQNKKYPIVETGGNKMWSNLSSVTDSRRLFGSYIFMSARTSGVPAVVPSDKIVVKIKVTTGNTNDLTPDGFQATSKCMWITTDSVKKSADNETETAELLSYDVFNSMKTKFTTAPTFKKTVRALLSSNMICEGKKVMFTCADSKNYFLDDNNSGVECGPKPVTLKGPGWSYDAKQYKFVCNAPAKQTGTGCYFNTKPYGSSIINDAVVCDADNTEKMEYDDDNLSTEYNEKPFICIKRCAGNTKNALKEAEDINYNIFYGYLLGTGSGTQGYFQDLDRCVVDLAAAKVACDTKTDADKREFDASTGACNCKDPNMAEDIDLKICMPVLKCDPESTTANLSGTKCSCNMINNYTMSGDGTSCSCNEGYIKSGNICRNISGLECIDDAGCKTGYKCVNYECIDDSGSGGGTGIGKNPCTKEGQTLLSGRTVCSCSDGYICSDRDASGNCLCEKDTTPVCAGNEELKDGVCVKPVVTARPKAIGGCASSIGGSNMAENTGTMLPYILALMLALAPRAVRRLSKHNLILIFIAAGIFFAEPWPATAAETCYPEQKGYKICNNNGLEYVRISNPSDFAKYHPLNSNNGWFGDFIKIKSPTAGSNTKGYAPIMGEKGLLNTLFCQNPCKYDKDNLSISGASYVIIAEPKGSYYNLYNPNTDSIIQQTPVTNIYYFGIKGDNPNNNNYEVIGIRPISIPQGAGTLANGALTVNWGCTVKGTKIQTNTSNTITLDASDNNFVSVVCSFNIPPGWKSSDEPTKKIYYNSQEKGSAKLILSNTTVSLSVNINVSGVYNQSKQLKIEGLTNGDLSIFQDIDPDAKLPVKSSDLTATVTFKLNKPCPNSSGLPEGDNADQCPKACTGEGVIFDKGSWTCSCQDQNYSYNTTAKKCVPKCTGGSVSPPDYTCKCPPGKSPDTVTSECKLTGGPTACSNNSECSVGEKCSNGTCVTDTSGDDSCRTIYDCNYGESCINLRCVPSGSCNSTSQCAVGQQCIGGYCSVAGGAANRCVLNTDCQFGLICSNMACVMPSGNGAMSCRFHIDCPSGQLCLNNLCYTPLTSSCKSDSDCGTGERCDTSAGLCATAGSGSGKESDNCKGSGWVWDNMLSRCVCDINNGWYMDGTTCVKDAAAATCESEGGVTLPDGTCSNPLKEECLKQNKQWISQECIDTSVSKAASGGCSINRTAEAGYGLWLLIAPLLLLLPLKTKLLK